MWFHKRAPNPSTALFSAFLKNIKGHQYANVHQNATTKPLEELILREHKQGKDKKGQKKGQNTNEMALRLLSIEASYVQSVLEETLDEVEDSGTCLAILESVSKSRERNKERNEIGEIEKKSRYDYADTLLYLFLKKIFHSKPYLIFMK